MGWMAIPLFGMWLTELGVQAVSLLLAEASATGRRDPYTRQTPNTWPDVWGYHEYFHVTVVLGAVLHYMAVWTVVV